MGGEGCGGFKWLVHNAAMKSRLQCPTPSVSGQWRIWPLPGRSGESWTGLEWFWALSIRPNIPVSNSGYSMWLMEQYFPVSPIFRNFRPTSRGTPKISEWNSGKCLFHSLPNAEFPEFLVEWKTPFVFFRAPKPLTAINTCLEEMEEFKWRGRPFVSD